MEFNCQRNKFYFIDILFKSLLFLSVWILDGYIIKPRSREEEEYSIR
jgi:hypothetical protein